MAEAGQVEAEVVGAVGPPAPITQLLWSADYSFFYDLPSANGNYPPWGIMQSATANKANHFGPKIDME